MNIYTENGWNNREDYFNALAIMYSIQIGAVYSLANDIGEEGDFNGELIQAVEKYERDLVMATSPAANELVALKREVADLEAQRSSMYIRARKGIVKGMYAGVAIGIVGTSLVSIVLYLI